MSASVHDFGDYSGVGVHRPLLAAGGLPVALPQMVEAVDPVLDAVDAIVLAPGRDIDPARYGQDPHALLAATEPQRDAFELALVSAALDRGLPVLEAASVAGLPVPPHPRHEIEITASSLLARAVLAVQWELQEEWRVDPRFARVFDWLVGAAADFGAGVDA